MLMQPIEEYSDSGSGTLSTHSNTILLSRSLGGNKKKFDVNLQPSFFRGETPDTILSLQSSYPDISVFCRLCGNHIFITELPKHKEYHRNLKTFEFKESDNVTMKDLIARRKALIQRLRQKPHSKLEEFAELDRIYDFLKKELFQNQTGATLPLRQHHVSVEDVISKGLRCSLTCCVGVGVASTDNTTWRQDMEDTSVYQDYFGNHASKAYMAVFDGYHGSFAAQVAADELHHAVLCEMLRFDPFTTCSCTYNMVEEHSVAAKEVHRPRTQHSERVQLHMTSTNLVEAIVHSCEERLDELAASAADKRTGSSAGGGPDDSTGGKVEMGKKGNSQETAFAEKMAAAFRKAYLYTDQLLMRGQDVYTTVRWSGCNATTVLMKETLTLPPVEKDDSKEDGSPLGSSKEGEDNKPEGSKELLNSAEEENGGGGEVEELARIYLANVGNSHAILLRDNYPYNVSKDHSTASPSERKRVRTLNGSLTKRKHEILLNGVVTATRGLGSHGDANLKRCLIADPYTMSVPVDARCQALVIGSGGLWSVLSEKEVASIVANELPCNWMNPPTDRSIDDLLYSDEPDYSFSSASDKAASEPSLLSVREDLEARGSEYSSASEKAVSELPASVKEGIVKEEASSDVSSQKNAVSEASSVEKKETTSSYKNSGSSSATMDEDGREAETRIHVDWGPMSTDAGTEFPVSTARHRSREPIDQNCRLAEEIARKVTQAALLAESHENVTVMVALFPAAVQQPEFMSTEKNTVSSPPSPESTNQFKGENEGEEVESLSREGLEGQQEQ